MTQIARLKDSEISNGNIINADDLGSEFNQLVNESNAQDTRLSTIEGAYVTLSGTNAFTGNNSFAGKVQLKDDGELTISSGAVTITGANHTIDTESDAATDDLDTISGGVDGAIITIQAENSARATTVKHNTGNIYNPVGADIILSDVYQAVLLQYQSALSKWVVLNYSKVSYPITSRSSNTILGASDKGKLFLFSSTFTQTFTAAATLGAGWWVDVRNDSTGGIILDPNSSETIDGQTVIYMFPGESFRIICDGSNFKTVGRTPPGQWILAQTLSPSGVSSVDDTFGFLPGYDQKWELTNWDHATTNTGLDMRISLDGSTYRSTAGDYTWNQGGFTATNGIGVSNTSDTELTIFDTSAGFSISSTGPQELTITSLVPDSSNDRKIFTIDGYAIRNSDGLPMRVVSDGSFKGTTGAILGVRFLSTSNFSGTIYKYVRRRV